MRKSLSSLLMLFTFAASAGCAEPVPPVNVQTMLEGMTDLRMLAQYPQPSFTSHQASSYDRHAKSPDERGWFANRDCTAFIREEDRNGRTEYVMMEADGPGAIMRIWSARPFGTIRIYLDGSDTPAIEAPMDKLLGGEFGPISSPLAGVRAKGWNLYFPLPYAESCKVTSDVNEGMCFYHVNYNTYPEGTEVQTFEMDHLDAFASQIEKTAAILSDPETAIGEAPAEAKTVEQSFQLAPDKQTEFEMPAPGQGGAIRKLDICVTGDNLTEILRGTVLRLSFDGEQTVEAPLGDFFGTSPGANAFETIAVGMLPAEDGRSAEMYCHLYMPYRKSAVVSLHNTTGEAVAFDITCQAVPYYWTDRSMYLHVGWRQEHGIATRPMHDWNYLTAEGKGVFVGAAVMIGNPVTRWWGEGDEKIWVDDDEFPSWFGTGTEDYYGYAWCAPTVFTHAYHSQPRVDGPGNFGMTSLNRFHMLDRIPFKERLKFDMEIWHWAECEVSMAVTCYWYARPGATDTYPPIRTDMLTTAFIEDFQIQDVEGAIEGEGMKVLEVDGKAAPQTVWLCSGGGRHLWWREGGEGGKLKLAFEAPEAGEYRVSARFVTARDYGRVQMHLNGEKAGDAIDLYTPNIGITENIELGTFDLKEGRNTLTAEIVGINPEAKKSYMFGLDYILLEPVEE